MSKRLFFYPDYRKTNDYQSMLYAALSQDTTAIAGSIEDAIAFAASTPEDEAIFHLHWPEPLFANLNSHAKRRNKSDSFIESVRRLQALGGRVIWTIHNKLPHDKTFIQDYIYFHELLAQNADIIHLHSEGAADLIGKIYKLPSDRTIVIPHGSYKGIYPAWHDRVDARRKLKLNQDAFIIGFFGQIRPYKGLDLLLASFRRLREEQPNVVLFVGGKATYPTKAGDWSSAAQLVPGLIVHERFIPTEELGLYYCAVDVVALPYTDILTSGSAMLAASFGKPFILPRLTSLSDYESSEACIMYDPAARDGLYDALRYATNLSNSDICELAQASDRLGSQNSWHNIAPRFAAIIEDNQLYDIESMLVDNIECYVRIPQQIRMAGVAVCVVDYYSSDETIELIRELPDKSGDKFIACYVLDNSGDERIFKKLCRSLPNAVILSAKKNLGYAGGNNILLSLAGRHNHLYALIINPDVRLEREAIDILIEFSSENEKAIFSPIVLKTDGKISFAGAFFVDGLDLEVLHYLDGQELSKAGTSPYRVDALNGCVLFFRLSVLSIIGIIPTSYFLYFEETDWFRQASKSGVDLWLVPKSKAIHAKASHGSSVPSLYYLYYYTRGQSLFAYRYNRSVEGAQQRLQSSFIAGWRKRLAATEPMFLQIFEIMIDAALVDGLARVEGPTDLGARLDLSSNSSDSVVGFVEETTEDGRFVGWVAKAQDLPLDIGAWLIINDVPVAYADVSIDRDDVAAAGYSKRAGFSITLPSKYLDGSLLRVQILSSHLAARLPFTRYNYAKSVDMRFAPTAPLELPPAYEGRVDGIKNGKLVGWAWDKANPSRTAYLRAKIFGQVIEIGAADIFRKDLKIAGKGSGSCGFECTLPKNVLRMDEISVELLPSDEKVEISRRKFSYKQPTNGFSTKFGMQDYLRWSYIEDKMPIGAFDDASLLRRHFQYLYNLYSFKSKRNIAKGPLVSVIMPVFNRENVIETAIKSVMSQTYENWEIIIVDDGSTDNSKQTIGLLLDDIGDHRIKVFSHPVNRGVSAARNTALLESTGDFICYLDSDNTWKADALAIMVQELIDYPEALAGYAGQEIWERVTEGEDMELRFVRAAPFNRSKLEYRNYIDLNVFIHRRSCLEKYGLFREDMRRLVDWELILRYTQERPPRFIPVLLSEYTVNNVKNQITRVESFPAALAGIKETLKKFETKTGTKHQRLSRKGVALVREVEGMPFSRWLSLSAEWLREADIRVFMLMPDGNCKISEIENVDDVIAKGCEPLFLLAQHISNLLQVAEGVDDIFLADTAHVAQAGWRSVVERASLAQISMAAGRSIPLAQMSTDSSSDSMPGRIASHVTHWEVAPLILGQRTSTLVPGWLWMSAALTDHLVSASMQGEHWIDILSLMCEKGEGNTDVQCAYLPDLVVATL